MNSLCNSVSRVPAHIRFMKSHDNFTLLRLVLNFIFPNDRRLNSADG